MSWFKKHCSFGLTYLVVPLCSTLYNILKVWTAPQCGAFDVNDDAVHTFVNLHVVQNILREGQFPFMNLWNNFGTPLIGDAITYPWALHAQTYWFVEPTTAMLINRLLLGFATILTLTIYFRKSMTRFSAVVGALFVMYTPGFIWHFAHHHYQASVLWMVLILLAQRHLTQRINGWRFALLCGALIMIVLNTSLNLVAFFLPFMLINQWIIAPTHRLRLLLLNITAIISGFLFSWPDTAYFFKAMQHSMRIDQVVTFNHINENINFSWLALALAMAGWWWSQRNKEHRTQGQQTCWLGFLPVVITALLVQFPDIWGHIYLLRSVDVSRLLWIAAIFIAVGMGLALDHLKQRWPPYGEKLAVTLGLLTASITMLYSGYHVLGYEKLTVCLPKYSHHFSPMMHAQFPIPGYTNAMEQQSRIAFEEKVWYAYDHKLIRDGYLSSSGRSMFMYKPFSEYLLKQDLIHVDQIPFAYHFKSPWNPKILHELGIRYFFQKEEDPDLVKRGFHFRAHTPDTFYLYENRYPTSLAYLSDHRPHFRKVIAPKDITLIGNDIHITLPPINHNMTLTATFVALQDWSASVDHKPRTIFHTDNHLLKINVAPGERQAVFRFQPFAIHDFLLNIFLALLIPVVILASVKPKTKLPHEK